MNKLIKNRHFLTLLVSLQEAFTTALPYILLTYGFLLLVSICKYLHCSLPLIPTQQLSALISVMAQFLPVILTISIAFFLSLRIKTSQIISIVLSLSVFITVTFIQTYPNFTLPKGFTPFALINPIVSTYLIKTLYPYLSLRIYRQDGNYHIYRLMNYLLVFIAVFFIMIAGYLFFRLVFESLLKEIINLKIDLPVIILLALRDFAIQVLWFFGVHGTHVINSIFGHDVFFNDLFHNLKYIEFHRLFVNIGGDGLGLPMAIAFLFALKDRTLKTLVKIGFPFTFLNVDTLLIYAVIILNRFFLLPFVFLPLINLTIAYFVLHIIDVQFTSYYLAWTTPPVMDAYLKTDGNPAVIALQIFLILFDVAVYYYFAKKFSASNTIISNKELLEKNLDIKDELKSKETILAFKTQKDLIAAQAQLEKVISTINKENLKVYYQPKVDIKHNKVQKFEALIRYRHNNKITGPTFLSIIETAGLAYIIDIWVCKQTIKHIKQWEEEGFYPEISINLHPDTLKNKEAIKNIIDILRNKNITFEIIERSLLYGKKAQDNIALLQKNGFKISIDDFGSGYSSLEIVTKLNVQELKIDKSLIDIVDTPKGFSVCKHTVEICHDFNALVVAEGVESKQQLEILKSIDVDLVQGYIFSPALPADKIKKFSENFDLKNFLN